MTEEARSSSDAEDAGRDDAVARRLEQHFLGDDIELTESLLRGLGDEADEMVRLLALNEVAERGLDLLEREGVAGAVDGVDVGRRLGDYRLIQEIGAGGMGVLYLAEDTVLGRLVALKLLTRQTATATERFRREAEIAASLEHPAIVPVYARGEHDGVHYIAMRYIAGKDIERTLTLSREASRSGTSGLYAHAARWCAVVADGLGHAHRSGVIHRDVKPSNILVEDDAPFLVDFGLARSTEVVTLTMSGDLLGTVPYMSPEQIRSEGDLDGRTDVYSLGATLYQLLAGVVPFAGRSSQAIAREILTRDPAPLRRYGVPRDLEAVVFRAMEKDRERRYADAEELRDDLERFLDHEPVRARHLGPARRVVRTLSRHRRLVGAVTVIVCLATLLGIRTWNSERDRRAAAEQTFEAAEVAASRGLYARAGEMLAELRRTRPGHPRLDARLAEYRKRDLHDRLMQFMLTVPADSRALAGDPSTERAMSAMLEEARRLEAADVLADEFRVLEVVWMWCADRRAEALGVLAGWERELGGRSRATFVLGRLLEVGFSSVDRATELPGLDDVPATRPVDLYATAFVLTLTKEDVGRGLRAAEKYLETDPTNFWARNMRAIFLRERGEFDRAREVYSAMIDLIDAPEAEGDRDGKVDFARYKRANVASLAHDYAAALADFEACGDTVAEWRLQRAVAHCHFGLGRTTRAISLYVASAERLEKRRAELATMEGLTDARRTAALESIDGHRADVLSELTLALRETGGFDEAQDAIERMSAMPGFEERADELLASVLLDRAIAECPPFSADLAPWRGVVSRLDAMSDARPENRRIDLARREARFWSSDLSGQERILEEAFAAPPQDDEERLWRSKVTVVFVGHVKWLMKSGLRADASPEDERTWRESERRLELQAHRAADDLGYLRRVGFARFKTSTNTDYADFLLGLARLWSGTPTTAEAIFAELESRPSARRHGWSASVGLHRAEALAASGRVDESLAKYFDLADAHPPMRIEALERACRLSARTRRMADFEEALEILEDEIGVDRLAAELQRSDYDRVRRTDVVRDLLDD